MARHRALVVDDNASLAQTVADLLTEEGFEVEVVATGAGALATPPGGRERPAPWPPGARAPRISW